MALSCRVISSANAGSAGSGLSKNRRFALSLIIHPQRQRASHFKRIILWLTYCLPGNWAGDWRMWRRCCRWSRACAGRGTGCMSQCGTSRGWQGSSPPAERNASRRRRSRPLAAAGSVRPAASCHVLGEAGFADPRGLQLVTEAWDKLLDAAAPDLVVFDHSPAAMLAAQGSAAEAGPAGQRFLLPAGLPAVARPAIAERQSSGSGTMSGTMYPWSWSA